MSIQSRRIAAAIAATALGLAVQPAFAEDTKAEPRSAAVPAYPVSEETRVCVRETLTGSHIPRTVCDTLQGWRAKGIDPFAGR